MNVKAITEKDLIEHVKAGDQNWVKNFCNRYNYLINNGGIKALEAAIESKDVEMVKYFLEKIPGAKINSTLLEKANHLINPPKTQTPEVT